MPKSATGYGLRATGYRLPATGYRLLAPGYWPTLITDIVCGLS